jgi:hypothetical protein
MSGHRHLFLQPILNGFGQIQSRQNGVRRGRPGFYVDAVLTSFFVQRLRSRCYKMFLVFCDSSAIFFCFSICQVPLLVCCHHPIIPLPSAALELYTATMSGAGRLTRPGYTFLYFFFLIFRLSLSVDPSP